MRSVGRSAVSKARPGPTGQQGSTGAAGAAAHRCRIGACQVACRGDGEDHGTVATKAIVGEKVGMTQVWDDQHRAVPVTVLKVQPLRVVRVKTPEREGYAAVQVTWGVRRPATLTKPEQGHYAAAGVEPGRRLLELRLDDTSGYQVGQQITADVLTAGERVDVISVSKGKGFAGGMKRHNFKGQGAAHGNHKKHRAPGSVGACATPARVFKGTRMAGRLGGQQVTTMNLQVVAADPERQLVMVKGAVPGPRGAVVVVRDTVKGAAARAGHGRVGRSA